MDLEARIGRLEDQAAIYDCLTAYCRGVDRLDRELLLSAYHPDAIDDHGVFVGSPVAFADWVFAFHRQNQSVTQHMLCNHRCDLDADLAHTETYYLTASLGPDGQRLPLSGGRYIDRFERRDGRWAIALRKCLFEWRGPVGEVSLHPGGPDWPLAGPVTRDRSDASYDRPLALDARRVGLVWPPFDLRRPTP